ncbi:MAG: hypothetical protein EHM72_12030, partial [Calditrichaeota bacterium]
MKMEKQEINYFTSLYQQLEKELPGEQLADISGTRKNAIAWFGENGFPSQREEEWRFTDVSPLRKTEFIPSRSSEQPQVTVQDIEPFINRESIGRLVFLNGHLASALSSVQSLPPGLTCTSLQQAME